MYFLLFYDVVDDYLERREPFRAEHLAYARQARERRELLLAGALANPIDRAVLLFSAPSATTVEGFARSDPYVRNGLVKQWTVREWSVVIGDKSLEALP
jgi:hypothetical protein